MVTDLVVLLISYSNTELAWAPLTFVISASNLLVNVATSEPKLEDLNDAVSRMQDVYPYHPQPRGDSGPLAASAGGPFIERHVPVGDGVPLAPARVPVLEPHGARLLGPWWSVQWRRERATRRRGRTACISVDSSCSDSRTRRMST